MLQPSIAKPLCCYRRMLIAKMVHLPNNEPYRPLKEPTCAHFWRGILAGVWYVHISTFVLNWEKVNLIY